MKQVASVVIFLVVASVLFWQQGSVNSQGMVDIRPMSDIYDTEPDIVDITDTSARFTFVTSIPVACSLIWGTDTDYGEIAVDPNMNGAAVIDHNINIGGLEPDTTYHWRIQGTAADGTIYIDDDYTFTTAPASDANEENIAALANGASIIGVSSNIGGGANDQSWGANSAIDGNPATAWSSNGDGNDAWIDIQLSREADIHAVDVWSRFMTNNTSQIFEFTLTTDKAEVFGPFTLPSGTPTASHRFEIEPTMPVASLRLDVTDSNGVNTGLIEFAAYTAPQNRGFLPLILNALGVDE